VHLCWKASFWCLFSTILQKYLHRITIHTLNHVLGLVYMVKESPLFWMEKKKKTFQNCTVQILGIIFKMFAFHFGDYKTKEPRTFICKLDGSKGFLYRNLGSKRVSKFHSKEKFLWFRSRTMKGYNSTWAGLGTIDSYRSLVGKACAVLNHSMKL